MFHNGENSSSETRPASSPAITPELSESQKQTVDKCTNIVQEFRTGRISKSKASLQLQRAIPHGDHDEDSFTSTYESYFDMLENFERYQNGSIERVDNVHQRLAGSDGHGSPTGKFMPTRTRTRRILYPFVRVRDSRAHGHGFEGSRGYENLYGVGVQAWHECLADAHQTSIDVGAPAARVLHTLHRGVLTTRMILVVVRSHQNKRPTPGSRLHVRGWVQSSPSL